MEPPGSRLLDLRKFSRVVEWVTIDTSHQLKYRLIRERALRILGNSAGESQHEIGPDADRHTGGLLHGVL
jgi:hypothetical protein